jgi:hypothetical protein
MVFMGASSVVGERVPSLLPAALMRQARDVQGHGAAEKLAMNDECKVWSVFLV